MDKETAEQAWKENSKRVFSVHSDLEGLLTDHYMIGIYDYREALRAEIEKEMKYNDERIASNYSDMENIVYKKVLQMLDSATPLKK